VFLELAKRCRDIVKHDFSVDYAIVVYVGILIFLSLKIVLEDFRVFKDRKPLG
jgi:hypothetical protein